MAATTGDSRDGRVPATWWWSLAAFVLAGLTGSLLRFGMLEGFPFGLEFLNVRHAHSHLMYFSWVTPALMVLMIVALRPARGRAFGIGVAAFALVCGLTTFVPFLLSGYGLMSIGPVRLPLSMMTSGLNGLAWYAFVAVYAFATWGRERTLALRAFDAALFLLVLASMGAVGLTALVLAGASDPAWMSALVDFFLDLFGEGWFTLALLGLAYLSFERVAGSRTAARGVEILALGLILRSLGALSSPLGIAWTSPFVALGVLLSGFGLLLCVLPLWRAGRTGWWTLPLVFLTVKGLVEIATTWPGVAASLEALALRVFLLHAFLLGAITLGLVASARATLGRSAARMPLFLHVAVLVLLVSLLPLSGAWPRAWSGTWALPVAAWVSLAPSFAVLALAWTGPWHGRRRTRLARVEAPSPMTTRQ